MTAARFDKEAIGELAKLEELIDEEVRPVLLRGPRHNRRGKCPFCESNIRTALQFNMKTGRWRCEACGAGGDCFDWVMATTGCELELAVELLATWVGVQPNGQ